MRLTKNSPLRSVSAIHHPLVSHPIYTTKERQYQHQPKILMMKIRQGHRQQESIGFTQEFLIWLRGHQFSFVTEFVLAWSLILVFSLVYIIDWILLIAESSAIRLRGNSTKKLCQTIPITPLPQTKKRFAGSTQDRVKQLVDILNKSNSTTTTPVEASSWSDDHVVNAIRNDIVARKLASLIMAESDEDDFSCHALRKQLGRIWPLLLKFPMSTSDTASKESQFEISLIVPAYKEKPEDIQSTLTNALSNCDNQHTVQVVVVDADAGGYQDLSKVLLSDGSKKGWGTLEVHSYTGGGGRGNTLNYGASKARGRILTFLHSDTLLPNHWDTMIRSTFLDKGRNTDRKTQLSVCAFSMGIDTSPSGLKGGRFPPGIIGADRILGYLRCKLCSLPYGDSALSFPASVFHYLGGYPDQPLMEDYEIITLLRRRSQRLSKESIVVLPARIQCSPRRWQTHGVCYTVLINLLCIRRYKSGATTEDLFEFYYKQPTKKTS